MKLLKVLLIASFVIAVGLILLYWFSRIAIVGFFGFLLLIVINIILLGCAFRKAKIGDDSLS